MTAREIPFTTVDAFTSKPFGGNPAAVIVWDDAALAADDQLAQQIAAEFNLSETAFSHRLQGGSDENPTYELRWRTPTTEVSRLGTDPLPHLCGTDTKGPSGTPLVSAYRRTSEVEANTQPNVFACLRSEMQRARHDGNGPHSLHAAPPLRNLDHLPESLQRYPRRSPCRNGTK